MAMPRLSTIALLLGYSIVACSSNVLGPDLGPTVGPEFSGLRIEVVSPETAEIGAAVVFQIRLTNIGTEPFIITDPQFDLYVLTRRGETLWNWLNDKVIIGGADITINPAETYDFDIEWNQELNNGEEIPPGSYSLFGMFYFPQPPALVSQTNSLTIVQRLAGQSNP